MSRVSEKSEVKENSSERPLEQPKAWWGIAIALPVVIAAGVLATAKIEQFQKSTAPAPVKPVKNSINATGRLEPQGEVVKLSAPISGTQPSRVQQMMVHEGQKVRKGQIVAFLDGRDTQIAALEEAKAKLQEARANFAQVRVASPRDMQAQAAVIARVEAQLRGERDAQQATITRLEAQLRGERVAQQATFNRVAAQLEGQRNTSRATVTRQQAEARNAEVDAQRYELLYREGAISKQELDRRRLSAVTASQQLNEGQSSRTQNIATLQQQLAEARATQVKTITTLQQQIIEARVTRDKTISTLQRQIDEEKARLNRIREVNPTDMQMAQARVNNAIALMRRAEAELSLSTVRAPITGEILKIHTKSGEAMNANGIAEIGRTDRMTVIAEIPEDGIGQVRLGQNATINSDNGAFKGEFKGTVSEIGRIIGKKDVLNTDPAADIDARVVEVKILLSPEDSLRVSGLTNAKVAVAIGI
jgi:HlyD family secretion protein